MSVLQETGPTLRTLAFAVLAFGCAGCTAPDGTGEQTDQEQQNLTQTIGEGAGPVEEPTWALAIHGGAGSANRATTDADDYYEALQEALSLGAEQLTAGEASLQVVENVVAALEDDERFNAGRGSVFTSIGTHELDAAIMDGRTLACGAVAGVKNVRNPVRLARRVMEDTRHVLMAGPGADNYGVIAGVRRQPQAYFTTDRQLQRFRELRAQRGISQEGSGDAVASAAGDYTGNAGATAGLGGASHLATVGAVAMDRYGNLAAATSTGGTMLKRIGRIGDVPVIGAGTYANNATAAVSCTGRGEEFIRHTVAYDVSARIEYGGLTLQEAARQVIQEKLRPGDGGLIAVGPDGTIAMEFNTNAMFRGAADSLGRFDVGIWDEVRSRRPSSDQPQARVPQ
ncbi:MAG: isoaspartyl peptidase/L-asparaginase [Acidobacteria bacterium]|nr:isoaspartyl peptidase/L-asparaginase [Acidobacteriota bacterium]